MPQVPAVPEAITGKISRVATGGDDTLEYWLDYIQSVHARSMDLSLARVREVFARLALAPVPHAVVSVAGTNGKGSSVAMLESIYRRGGYRVGSYTSPHLVRYNERVKVDGACASDDELCRAFARVEAARADIPLTYFEFGTLAALLVFRARGVEVAVLEVGLGGRKDAVNVLDADVALIASVGIDHTQWLGTTRDAIGREKAGIFRSGRPAVCADPRPPACIAERAVSIGAELWQLGRDFGYETTAAGWSWWARQAERGLEERHDGLPPPPLRGDRQIENAAGVLMAVTALQHRLCVDNESLREGLSSTRLHGRLQVIPGPPLQVLDVAHNPGAVRILRSFLRAQPCAGRTIAVFAALADKPVREMARLLAGIVHAWHVAGLDVERGMSRAQVRRHVEAVAQDAPVSDHEDAVTAYAVALEQASRNDRIVVFGSFYTVGAIIAALNTTGA